MTRIKDSAEKLIRDHGPEGALRIAHEIRRRASLTACPGPTPREALKRAMIVDIEEGGDEWWLYCYKAAASLHRCQMDQPRMYPWGDHTAPLIWRYYTVRPLIQEVLAEVLGEDREAHGEAPYDWTDSRLQDLEDS